MVKVFWFNTAKNIPLFVLEFYLAYLLKLIEQLFLRYNFLDTINYSNFNVASSKNRIIQDLKLFEKIKTSKVQQISMLDNVFTEFMSNVAK